jgi:hypothetical protein
MKLLVRDADKLIFEPSPLETRVAGALICALAFAAGVFGIFGFASAIGDWFDHSRTGVDAFMLATISGIFSTAALALGSQAPFVALPFRLEVHRNPPQAFYAWRAWRVKQRNFATPQCVVAEVFRGRSRHLFIFVHVRFASGSTKLLTHPGHWSSVNDACAAAAAVGSEFSALFQCPLEITGPDAAHLGDRQRR